MAGAEPDDRLSVSTGVSHTDVCGPTLGALYRVADERLYRSRERLRAGEPDPV